MLLTICTCCTLTLFEWLLLVLTSAGVRRSPVTTQVFAQTEGCKKVTSVFVPPCACVSLTATFIYGVVARKEKQSGRSPPSAGWAVFLLAWRIRWSFSSWAGAAGPPSRGLGWKKNPLTSLRPALVFCLPSGHSRLLDFGFNCFKCSVTHYSITTCDPK